MAFINLGQIIYPIGAIYQSWSSTSPSTLFGGTWTQITDRFLYCKDSAGKTGGESSHTLNANEIPKHSHAQNVYSTDGESTTIPPWSMFIGDRWASTGAVRCNDSSTTRKANYGSTGFGQTSVIGGGNLTTICPTILPVILGDVQLSQYVIGGTL